MAWRGWQGSLYQAGPTQRRCEVSAVAVGARRSKVFNEPGMERHATPHLGEGKGTVTARRTYPFPRRVEKGGDDARGPPGCRVPAPCCCSCCRKFKIKTSKIVKTHSVKGSQDEHMKGWHKKSRSPPETLEACWKHGRNKVSEGRQVIVSE